MIAQNPHGGLTWRTMRTVPGCDELRIEVAWGAWPYKIVAYADSALAARYVPDAPLRQQWVERGDRSFEAMLSEARAIVEGWEAQITADLARAGMESVR